MSDILFRFVLPEQKILLKTRMLKGDRGAQGVSIVSIEKTSTVGLVDTYTITMNDGTTYNFEVKNGANAYCDDELSLESENAVQNKVITAVINSINDTLANIQVYDSALSLSSTNAVKNSVITAAINTLTTALENAQVYDNALSLSSENAVQNKVVTQALNQKANSSALNDYYPKSDVDNLFDNLGASSIDFNNEDSGLNATDVQAAIDEVVEDLGGKQDELSAGDNIQISGNVISATDTRPSTLYTDNTPSAISVPSSTSWQLLTNTPLLTAPDGGLWIVQVSVSFTSNSTGYRGVGISNSTTVTPAVIGSEQITAVNGAVTNMSFTTLLQPVSGTSYYIWVRQNSGSALNVTYRYKYVRLK